jgi:hypothetical protein
MTEDQIKLARGALTRLMQAARAAGNGANITQDGLLVHSVLWWSIDARETLAKIDGDHEGAYLRSGGGAQDVQELLSPG